MTTVETVRSPVTESADATIEPTLLAGSPGALPPSPASAQDALLASGVGDPLVAGVDGFRTRTVIGDDERIRIQDTAAEPFRRICNLTIESGQGVYVGTGSLIGPRTVLTAGHCIYHTPTMRGWARKIIVTPGRNGADKPFGSFESSRFLTLNKWVEDENPDFDIGCIQLDSPIGDQLGTFSLASLPPAELANRRVNVCGYPVDKGGRQSWFHADQVLAVGPRRVFYATDTYGGQSGAPAWVYDGDDRADPIQIAVHAYGTGATPSNLGVAANSAPLLIPEVMDQIRTWLAEAGG